MNNNNPNPNNLTSIQKKEALLRSPTTETPYIKTAERKEIANLLSDLKKILIEVNAVDSIEGSSKIQHILQELKNLQVNYQSLIDDL